MFDMRTILLLTIAYSFFSGTAMILFGFYRKRAKGLKIIGSGIITYGLGFFILSGRDILPVFMTVIVANMAIYLGVAFILKGLTAFRGLKIHWTPQFLLVGLGVFISFIYFTYYSPIIKYRIIIITLATLIMFCEILFVIFYKNKNVIFKESIILSMFFIVAIIIFIVRLFVAYFETEMVSFMAASDIHILSVIVYQVMPFVLVITTFWVSNTLMEKDLRTLSMTDSLTGLYNRAAILHVADQTIDMHSRDEKAIGVAMCDIDHFKRINDTYGHPVGDEVIIGVANILKEHLRFGDFIGRYGGEEFLLVLHAIDEKDLKKKLEHLRAHIEEIIYESIHANERVTMSFGGYVIHENYDLNEAVKCADEALYSAKNSGRNKVCLYGK